MALDSFLLALLEDPVDHGALLYVESANVLYNPRTRAAYEVRDDIAVMLPDETTAATDAQHQAWTSDPSAVKTGRPLDN
jgi:uncharacterized protein YbaR (Trm112 family)